MCWLPGTGKETHTNMMRLFIRGKRDKLEAAALDVAKEKRSKMREPCPFIIAPMYGLGHLAALTHKQDAYCSDDEKNRCAGKDQAITKFYMSLSASHADDEAAK